MSSTVAARSVRGTETPSRTRRSRLLVLAAIVLVAAIPALLFNAFWLFIAAQVAAYAIATLGLDVLYGRTGQLSLAHASFMGVGAYTGYVLSQHGQGVVLQLLAVCVLSLVAGAVVSVPTLRLSGLRLALVTLAFGELFAWLLINNTDITGGTQGATITPLLIGPLDVSVPLYAYLLTLIVAAGATIVVLYLGRTQLGRAMRIVRDSEIAAQSMGVPIAKTKIAAFLIAALFAGVAGWLYGAINGFISPTDFNLFASVYLFVAVVVGGAGSVLGAWLGAAYVVVVPQLFTLAGFPNLYAIVGGALLAIIALLAPDGIVGLGRGLIRQSRKKRGSRAEPG